ncbi:hypothetical protein E4T56_gene20246 [Termitomyces sp. T112]|nr:hypothetical protein E4T56_gene20246 [Termitomyces sp. T112]
MSARKISEKAIEMPKNPHFLDFERSDGNSSRWPTNTTRVVDSSGEVNYMQPLTLEHPQTIKWRLGVAQAIAAATGMPASPSYILREWPAGYAFFDHHKGPALNPRHDLYLFGSVNRRYRSINEFIPHAIWLYRNSTMDMSKCLCKYCRKLPQREVTASHAPGIMRASHNSPSTPRSRPGRPKAVHEVAAKRAHDKVYASVQRAPLPVISKSPNVHSKATMLVERNSDLRAVSSKTSMKLRRWFRTGELLWCALTRPIEGPNNTAIYFWPGLVDEVKLKSRPVPRKTLAETRAPLENGKAPDVAVRDTSDIVPWSISQSTEYRMQLLAVNHTYLVSDDQVLPYQAHVPSDDLITALKAFPTERLNFDRDSMSKFNPCPKEGGARFDDAVAPYAMAVQIGSTLSGYWCLTDEWAFEYHLGQDVFPTPTPPRPKSAPSLATSLSAVIEAAGQHNAQTNYPISSGPSSSSGPKPHLNGNYYPAVSGANPDMSSSEAQRLSARILGKMASPLGENPPPLTQMRFQGLWWGAERIWTDEFVRLKVPRRCIAPLGAEHIFPPSGPGKSTLAMWEASGKDIKELGAGSRGVFMRLDGLFVVDALQGDGFSTKKECRASGMLYELADVDWEEDSVILDSSSKENTAPMIFIPAPSPLNPHVLPHLNSEPNISVTTRPQQLTPNPLPPTAQQSHPLRSHYTLPEAPTGYFFRPILPEGYEAVVSLSFISGRYYPRILSHPLLEKYVEMAMTNTSGLLEHNNLWALEGLSAGFHNSVDPVHYKSSRMKMIEDADVTSVRELEIHKHERMRELEDENMEDVDELAYPDAMDVAD